MMSLVLIPHCVPRSDETLNPIQMKLNRDSSPHIKFYTAVWRDNLGAGSVTLSDKKTLIMAFPCH